MFNILNRFARILSIVLGLFIALLLAFLFFMSGGSGEFSMFSGDLFSGGSFLISVFLGIVFLLKFILFSEDFIVNGMKKFIKKLDERFIKNDSSNLIQQEKKAVVDTQKEIVYKSEFTHSDNVSLLAEHHGENRQIKENLEKEVEKEKKKSPSAFQIAVQNFFKENLLAKIGAILVFIGVLFLLSFVRNEIPSILKLIIGFVIGFSIYFLGVYLDKKGIIGESRILLGAGILTNFLVILGGRYVLSGIDEISASSFSPLLNTTMTFLLLILNTGFSIFTSLIYKSKTLLIFSFLFAYVNPFLLGEHSNSPYILVGYSMIISLGALFITRKNNFSSLGFMVLILGNILFFLAPFSNEIGRITKFLSSAILGILTIISLPKQAKKYWLRCFLGVYSFLFLILTGASKEIFQGDLSYISYMVTLISLTAFSVYIINKNKINGLNSAIFGPIVLFLFSMFFLDGAFLGLSIGILSLIYLVASKFLLNIFSTFFKYLYFVVLGGFIIIGSTYLSIGNLYGSALSFLIIIGVALLFFFLSYFLSRKKTLEYLYPIGTLSTIFILFPILKYGNLVSFDFFSNKIVFISIVTVFIFMICNSVFPLFCKSLTGENANIKSLVSGNIMGTLFGSFMLFDYGNAYFPGVSLGIGFTILAVYYFIIGFIFINKLGFEKIKKNISLQNIFYLYMAISIAIFSFSVALIFANRPEIISAIWLVEASVLFFLYKKTDHKKIFDFAFVIFAIGIWKLFKIFGMGDIYGEYTFLISASIILISLFLNVVFIENLKDDNRKPLHDISHMLGVITISYFIKQIIIPTGHGFVIFSIAIFITILGLFYSKFGSKLLKWFFIVVIGLFGLSHIFAFDHIDGNLAKDSMNYLVILQYISTILISGIVIFWNKFSKEKGFNYILNWILVIYLIIILSLYVFDLSENTFVLTIFWGIISSTILVTGILKDKKVLRTSGLYLLSLVLLKIAMYDVWYGFENAFSRIIVFIVLGIILIMVSIMYSKKYGNDLSGEFAFKNLLPKE